MMTLVDGEKAVERALDTAADRGGGLALLRMRGSGVTRRSECADGPPILIEAAHSHTMRNTAR